MRPLTATVLFDLPQSEIATLITDRMDRATEFSIVTGFATPGGVAAISAPIRKRPLSLGSMVVGAATYPGYTALDALLAAGVPPDRLHVHLGHSAATGGHRNPFARFHPMLHSKIYYMEHQDGNASAFIGSHNVTAFALGGLNGEASVLLEGAKESPEFEKVRQHIASARRQAVSYSSGMKEAYAWWTREFIEGLKAETKLPQDGTTVRTILLFASASPTDRPKIGENIYFEIPSGIEQIESLKTETHLFLFDTLPATPLRALELARSATARFTCATLGAENKRGNKELVAQWRIDQGPRPALHRVAGAIHRPSPPAGMQQVRAEIKTRSVEDFEYLFEREVTAWDPVFDPNGELHVAPDRERTQASVLQLPEASPGDFAGLDNEALLFLEEARGRSRQLEGWKRVSALTRRQGSPREKDEDALKRATPDSGSFILVSLRRRARSEISVA